MIRTLTWMSRVPPTRRKVMFSRTFSSLTCRFTGISPTSSRKSVPPLASSRSPAFCARASVKAPFSWPKSSLSSSSRGMAAQLISRNGFTARGDWRWIKLAMICLPVPLSPVMSTDVESLPATFSATS